MSNLNHIPITFPNVDQHIPVDFTSDPDVVRLFVEGERLSYGHLFNPAFATEISMIEPVPHQRIAVYDHMLQQPRLRFLLADDAGAGKTILTGLYIREMLTRRLISRVLIVPPAGLVGNWEHEMRSLFNLNLPTVVSIWWNVLTVEECVLSPQARVFSGSNRTPDASSRLP